MNGVINVVQLTQNLIIANNMKTETESFLTQNGLWNNIEQVSLSRNKLAELLEAYKSLSSSPVVDGKEAIESLFLERCVNHGCIFNVPNTCKNIDIGSTCKSRKI